MFRAHVAISEDDLEELNQYIREVIDNADQFDYRQHELKQAPAGKTLQQVEHISLLVASLKEYMDKANPLQCKTKMNQLETVLMELKANKEDEFHVRQVIDKAGDILGKCKQIERNWKNNKEETKQSLNKAKKPR